MAVPQATRRATIGFLAAFALAGTAAAQSALDGTYRVQGRNPDGSAYAGAVRLVEPGGSVAMTWQVGNRTYQGTGSFDGRLMIVNWGDRYPVVYVLMSDGTLHGTWSNGRALEKLSR